MPGTTSVEPSCISPPAAPTPASLEHLRLLLSIPGINVNIPDRESNWTPLHRALYAGNIPTAYVPCAISVLILISSGSESFYCSARILTSTPRTSRDARHLKSTTRPFKELLRLTIAIVPASSSRKLLYVLRNFILGEPIGSYSNQSCRSLYHDYYSLKQERYPWSE